MPYTCVTLMHHVFVLQEPRTSNIARESGMAAGIPISVPAHTVAQACISGAFLVVYSFVCSC